MKHYTKPTTERITVHNEGHLMKVSIKAFNKKGQFTTGTIVEGDLDYKVLTPGDGSDANAKENRHHNLWED